MTPPLSQFPDICLLAMFKHIPLNDMIRNIGSVTKNWVRLQREELSHRHSLVLVSGRDSFESIHENPFGSELIEHVRRDDDLPWVRSIRTFSQLKFDSLTGPFTNSMMNILPNITHLTLMVQSNNLQQMTRLLNHYSTNLISLNIKFCDKFDDGTRVLELFDSINNLQSLRHLNLNDCDFNGLKVEPKLTILSRLDTFTTRRFCPAESIIAPFRQFASTGNVQIDYESVALKLATEWEPELASRFSGITLTGRLFSNNFDKLLQFGQLFVCLTRLSLCIYSIDPLEMLARCLQPLTRLIHLKVDLQLPPLDYEKLRLGSTHKIKEKYVPIGSVRLLTLSIVTFSHLDSLVFEDIADNFPNVQVLDFSQCPLECADCEYNRGSLIHSKMDQDEIIDRLEKCMRLTRVPFRQFVHLHTIKLGTSGNELPGLVTQGFITRDQL